MAEDFDPRLCLTPAVLAPEFREVMGHFASGVTVITTVRENEPPLGTTASAVTSLSLDPCMLLICLNASSATCQAIQETNLFAVNILAEYQSEVAARMATKDPNKSTGLGVARGACGLPLLAGSLAHVECQVTERMRGGSHYVFIAKALRLSAHANAGAPLAYFRGRFARLETLAEPDRQ